MRYHRYRYNIDKWMKQKKWDPFRYYNNGYKYGHRMLQSGYYENQTYGALQKCWVGFVIAKEKEEYDKLEIYAKRIRKLELELGIELTDFSNWGM